MPLCLLQHETALRTVLGMREPVVLAPMEWNMSLVADQLAEERLQAGTTKRRAAAALPSDYSARSLATLIETARREIDSDLEAAKALLITASSVLLSEIERSSGANGFKP